LRWKNWLLKCWLWKDAAAPAAIANSFAVTIEKFSDDVQPQRYSGIVTAAYFCGGYRLF